MREDEILAQLVTELEGATPSGTDVRTTGGDQDAGPGEVVLDWDTTRLPQANGHSSFAGYVTNNSGDIIGIEHHLYFRMEVDCRVRQDSELDRDTVVHDVHTALAPYERDATAFDPDTREWEIASSGPRETNVIEPDWYEGGVLVRFEYVKRAEQTSGLPDTIQDIQTTVEPDESLEGANITNN